MQFKSVIGMGALLLGLLSGVAQATEESYQRFQHGWELAQYQTPAAEQRQQFARLAGEVRQAVKAAPDDLKLRTWEGIILSSYAGVAGPLDALSLAKEAKASYEAVIARDATVLKGSPLTSLGVLYYKVPGWPLGFGNDDRAAALLKRGLALNPDGIDSNYFYADFLIDQGHPEQARAYLQKALAATARPGREIADTGRRCEVKQLLARIGR